MLYSTILQRERLITVEWFCRTRTFREGNGKSSVLKETHGEKNNLELFCRTFYYDKYTSIYKHNFKSYKSFSTQQSCIDKLGKKSLEFLCSTMEFCLEKMIYLMKFQCRKYLVIRISNSGCSLISLYHNLCNFDLPYGFLITLWQNG